jgi:hypothetical protein
MSDRGEEQRRLTLEQFTKQAGPFAAMPAHSDADVAWPRRPAMSLGWT